MNKKHTYFIILLLFAFILNAQTWSLQLKSRVELRTFKLTNKADITEQGVAGASVILYKGSTIVTQVLSNASGDFEVFVPANGEYVLSVSYPGCNTKKFMVNTMNVPENIVRDNYKPSFGIEAVIMAKAFNGINYSVLQQSLVKIFYQDKGHKFDDDENYTNQMLGQIGSYRNSENILIESFVSTNASGDEALRKGDCPLAKSLYEKAMTIIPGEFYPKQQLELVGKCLKDKENQEKAKAEAEKLAAEKAVADKLAAEQAAKAKEEADKVATEKAAKEKAEKDKLAAEKAAADKLANEQAAKAKEEADKVASEKAVKEKAEKDKLAAEKATADKLAAEQAAKVAAEKAAKEKTEKEKLAAENAAADKLAAEKVAKEKAEKDKLAAEKAAADKIAAEQAAKAKAAADKLVKEQAAKDKIEKDKQLAEKAIADKIAAEKAAKEKLAADKLAREKEETERLAREKAEKEKGIKVIYTGGTGEEPGSIKTGDSDHSVPQVLGADNKYKEAIKRADELFKMKRYKEAKPMYEEALKYKANDPHSTNRLVEIEKLINK